MAYSPYSDPHYQAQFFKELKEISKGYQYDWQRIVGYKAWLRGLYR